MSKTLRHKFYQASFWLIVVLGWEFLPRLFGVPAYIFPRLSDIIESASEAPRLLEYFSTTLIESLGGFTLGSIIGLAFGVWMAESEGFRKVVSPLVVASNAVPVIALAPIFVLWFGHGLSSKIAVSAFLCFFPLAINSYKGLSSIKPEIKRLFTLNGASKKELLMKYKFPNAVPLLFAGLKLNATYSVVGAVVAEFIGSDSGLGFGMLQASYSLNSPRLWAYILISCLLGVLFYTLVGWVEKYFVKYSRQ